MPIVADDVSPEQLNNAYRKEIDSDVKERILLVSVLGLIVRKHPESQKENYTNPDGGPTSG